MVVLMMLVVGRMRLHGFGLPCRGCLFMNVWLHIHLGLHVLLLLGVMLLLKKLQFDRHGSLGMVRMWLLLLQWLSKLQVQLLLVRDWLLSPPGQR